MGFWNRSTDQKRPTHPIAWVAVGVLVAAGVWYLQSPHFQHDFGPELPIAISTRPALLDSGRVLMIRNNGPQRLNLSVVLTDPATRASRRFEISVRPDHSNSIGHIEGWSLETGHEVEITHPEFRSWRGRVPPG